MKKSLILLMIIMVSVIGMTCTESAALSINPVGDWYVVEDPDNNLMWADLNMFTGMTLAEVNSQIDAINSEMFAGTSGWELASLGEVYNLVHDRVDDFFSITFTGATSTVSVYASWDGRCIPELLSGFYLSHNRLATTNVIFLTDIDDTESDPIVGAWVKAPLVQASEPVTMFLFGTGLIGLVGFRRKFKK